MLLMLSRHSQYNHTNHITVKYELCITVYRMVASRDERERAAIQNPSPRVYQRLHTRQEESKSRTTFNFNTLLLFFNCIVLYITALLCLIHTLVGAAVLVDIYI